ncbi:uncharacterized protein [Drosophila tropicalis]|uniref:uncharacterized protein n=1 Tax=Drosophila tropicalis TaxID=46794 RepID=UPI0035AB9578
MKCLVSDRTFMGVEYCRIKSVNRTYKYFSLKFNLFKVPVENATVNIVLYKRFNDYKPFLYNVTIDTCRFLASRNRNPFFNILYGLFSQQSNANHSCPYDHDIIVDKVTVDFLNHHVARFIPIPSGDYAVFSNCGVGVNNTSTATKHKEHIKYTPRYTMIPPAHDDGDDDDEEGRQQKCS